MNPHPAHYLLLAIWLLAASISLHAQSPSYHRYTTADGLPTNYVYGVVEDADGFIWAYTENGLAKFDGYTFEHFNTKDGLPGNDIPWALRAPDGKIFLYTYKNQPAYLLNDSIHVISDYPSRLLGLLPDGKATYSSYNDEFGTYVFVYGSEKSSIPHIISTEEFRRFGRGWKPLKSFANTKAGTKKAEEYIYSGIGAFNYTGTKDSIVFWDMRDNPLYKRLKSATEFFYYSNDSLYWQVNDHWRTAFLPIVKFPPNVFPISDVPRKWVWQTLEYDYYYLFDENSGEIQRISLSNYGIMLRAHSTVSVQDSSFWLASDAGSIQLNHAGELMRKIDWSAKEQRWTPLRTYTDRGGNTWQGSRNGGLLMIPFAAWAIRTRTLPPSGNQYLKRLRKMPDGRILGIADNGQVYEILPDSIRSVYRPKTEQQLRSECLLHNQLLLSLNSSILLLSFADGLVTAANFHEAHDFVFTESSSVYFDRNAITVAYQADNNQLYTAYAYTTVYRWDLTVDGALHKAKRLVDKVKLLHVHPTTGTVYGGNIDGLSFLQGERFLPLLAGRDELNNISALFGTPGKLWIGTESNGLFCYDIEQGELDQITDNVFISAIRTDGDDGILAVTDNGILVVPFDEPVSFQEYTPVNGLPDGEVKDVLALGDSVLLVASSKGLYELRRDRFGLPPKEEGAFGLKDIYADDELIELAKLSELPYTTNQLDFNFHLRSYACKGNVVYRTRLAPLETDFQESRERFRRYTGLRPGEYQFYAEAVDSYGRTFSLLPLRVYIRPALWQRTWFRVLITMGLLAGAFFLGMRRLKKAKQQLADEQALNQRLATMELEALKAQMNPHFIFNALGSIQYFIQTQEVELADDYLTRFASLMRQYLDSSRETLLPIEQEIALLTNYTELEQMRFEELFGVEILIKKELAVSGFQIPTMIIQPFVENAINHGLSERRDGKGLLVIQFGRTSLDTLYCTVQDNGIGRKRSALRDRAGHQSRGMKIVQEKIDTLATADLLTVNYTITDAFPGTENFPGTLVTLHFKSPDYANP